MDNLISIHLIVRNGEKYLRHCLDAVLAQSYRDFALVIFDNNSTDRTRDIIKSHQLSAISCQLIEHSVNLATWGGFEESLKYSQTKYVVLLSVDVLLDKDFLKNAVAVLESDNQIGALQAKIRQWHFDPAGQIKKTNRLDTVGFKIFRNRRLINIGQGEEDRGQYDADREVFGVEGAVPVFRRAALEDSRVSQGRPLVRGWTSDNSDNEIVDHDMFWYGDDLDLVWRMRLFGWKQVYAPTVVAWHDRSTTKDIKRHWYDHFSRIGARRQIPIRKRRLDWRNYRLALVKNEFAVNFLKDLPHIFVREIMVLGYALLFEPGIFWEIPRFFQLLPRMLKKRREIMRRVRVTPAAIRQWMR